MEGITYSLVNRIWDKYYPDENIKSLEFISRYDCYNWKLGQPNNGRIMIRVSPRLEIFTKTDVVFLGELTLDFRVSNVDEEMRRIITYCLKNAHVFFIATFGEVEAGRPLMKYNPTFSNEEMEDRFRHHSYLNS
jgi:hypothetical protein